MNIIQQQMKTIQTQMNSIQTHLKTTYTTYERHTQKPYGNDAQNLYDNQTKTHENHTQI